MKRLLLIFLAAGVSVMVAVGQYPQRTWHDNFSYNYGMSVTEGDAKLFCSTISGIIVADTRYNSVTRLSTVNGLTETNIRTIAWSGETSTLIIAYASTNIDLLKDNSIENIPEVMRKSIPGLKEIYRIRTRGSFAYLACSFGIVVLDLNRNEVRDTWKPGTGTLSNPVYDVTFLNEKILAATSTGVYEAPLSAEGLAYFGNWIRHDGLPTPSASYNCIANVDGNLFVNRKSSASDSVFIYNGNWNYLYNTGGISNLTFEATGDSELAVSSALDVKILTQAGAITRTITAYGEFEAMPSNALKNGLTVWIADRRYGLVAIHPSGHEVYLPDGPDYNSVISLTASAGHVYAAGGAVDNAWNNSWKMLEVSYLIDNLWSSLPQSDFRDAMRVIPGKNNNYFVSTWGMGLLEYSGTTLLNQYNEYNSPLNSIIPGSNYTRICGMAFDSNDNLWIAQSGVTQNIKVLRPDRSWITLPVTVDAPTLGDLIITGTGTKWIVLPRGHGLFVLNDNGTPGQFDDDTYRKLIVRDTDDKILSYVYSVTEDLDGNIWVGTDQGPAIYYNPDRALTEDIRAVRIKIPRNDGTGLADYMLGTELITSIAVDGANRKWVGTFNSGAYLLSADGTRMIAGFNEDNSPLPSNTVASIATDHSTGLVWFGTAEGIIAYHSDAPAGGEKLSGVYSFPNPVRPDFEGVVTIAGLVRDTRVKITDISGNLVFETISTGGEATWNLNNYRGQRVSSGVYLAFCSTPDGSGSAVVKILIVTGN
ncbi:MAG: hypothetical protein RBS37_06135 [Bacteroidales bacterium]|jgi:hypothetical protein|nr:hypothetical protein [Bacteroidales bacterium]